MIGTQKIIFKDGELIPVEAGVVGEEPPLWVNEKGYVVAYHPRLKRWISVHKVVDAYYNGSRAKNIVIHHKDFNHQNNRIDNLVRMDKIEHFLYHSTCQEWRSLQSRQGMLGKHHSEETKAKISASNRGKPRLSGPDHPMWGKHMPPELIEKLRYMHLGEKQSPETVEKRRQKLIGQKRTPEQCQKFREIRSRPEFADKIAEIGRANKGRKHSNETKNKYSESMKRRWSDPEYKKKHALMQAEILKERWQDPEFKKRMSEVERKPMSDEARKNISVAAKNKVFSEEYRQHMSEAQKRLWSDPEFQKRKAEERKARVYSDEARKKMSDGPRGRVITDEYRHRLSEAQKSAWQRRKATDMEVGQLPRSIVA